MMNTSLNYNFLIILGKLSMLTTGWNLGGKFLKKLWYRVGKKGEGEGITEKTWFYLLSGPAKRFWH